MPGEPASAHAGCTTGKRGTARRGEEGGASPPLSSPPLRRPPMIRLMLARWLPEPKLTSGAKANFDRWTTCVHWQGLTRVPVPLKRQKSNSRGARGRRGGGNPPSLSLGLPKRQGGGEGTGALCTGVRVVSQPNFRINLQIRGGKQALHTRVSKQTSEGPGVVLA